MNPRSVVRPLVEHDVGELVALCREHASFEQAEWPLEGETGSLFSSKLEAR